MEEKKLLKEVATAIVEQPVILEIPVLHPTLWQRIKREKKKRFTLKPLVLGKLIQISNVLLDFDKPEKKEGIDLVTALASLNGDRLASIVAICISPDRFYSEELKRFVLNNLSVQNLRKAAEVVLSQLAIQDFLSTIVMLRGTTILKEETSPQNPEIIAGIASGEPSDQS